MASLSSAASSPPSTPFRRKTKSCARKCERGCCAVATYFPLAFVYGLTTWAVWVEAGLGLSGKAKSWGARPTSMIGILLYLLLNTCYTVAVVTDPGSPLTPHSSRKDAQYSVLPTAEPQDTPINYQPVTVSSTGHTRYCKKCQTAKPDRTHHCSTCRRCVLKMDHHCPWLATCLGLHNYKPFVLFLVYTCLFCWLCFFSAAYWVWTELFAETQYLDEYAPVNIILLVVIAGIIGLVLTGFTGWHFYLCCRGQTTIECLEKTRYLSGVRRQVERNRQDQMAQHARQPSNFSETLHHAGQQILEFHANAVPGASRFEEGEEHSSPPAHHSNAPPGAAEPDFYSDTPAQQSLRRTYSALEEQRERDRYEDYLDDTASQKLPNAFDLGWRRNLAHLFGPNPLLWALPVCNTTGDGWHWDISQKWIDANEEAAATPLRHQATHPGAPDMGYDGTHDLEHGHAAVSMQTLHRPGHTAATSRRRREVELDDDGNVERYEVSSDEDTDDAWGDGARQHPARRKGGGRSR